MPNQLSRDSFAFRSDSALAQIAFVRAGYGIGRGPDITVRNDPDLVAVLADQ